MRNKDIERIPDGYQGANYRYPVVFRDKNIYFSNAWCWQDGTYTEHSFHDDISRGVGERCCMNCGNEYAVAISVTRFPPEATAWLLDRMNYELRNW